MKKKKDKRRIAKKLRSTGQSYSEIAQVTGVTKSTVSRWCRDIKLGDKEIERLERRKVEGGKRGRAKAAKIKKKETNQRIKRAIELGRKEVGLVTKRDRFVAGISLYAGDGRKGLYSKASFANSDPQLIEFMMGWFRDFCKVPCDKFRGAIWIHDNQDIEGAEVFWSRLTGIPLDHLHKTYKVSYNKDTSKKNRHKNGVFKIIVCDVQLQRKIMGWMSKLLSMNPR